MNLKYTPIYICLCLLLGINLCNVTAPDAPETPKGVNGIEEPKK